MWKRLKKFVDLFSASNKKKDVVSTGEEKEKEEIDPRLQAELDVMKILNSEKNKAINREEVVSFDLVIHRLEKAVAQKGYQSMLCF